MVGTAINLVQRPQVYIKINHAITVRRPFGMAKEQKRKVELLGVEPRAFSLTVPSALPLSYVQLPLATTPHSCPYVACSSVH